MSNTGLTVFCDSFVTFGAHALAVLLIIFSLTVQALRREEFMPSLRLQETHLLPELSLRSGHRWMLFVSHVWSTGQDQAATIKRQVDVAQIPVRTCALPACPLATAIAPHLTALPTDRSVLTRRSHRRRWRGCFRRSQSSSM